MNILKIITISLLTGSLTFAGEAENKTAKPSVVAALYDKFVADNSKDVEKSYDAYLKSLEATNKRVIAALEAVKKDMNDPKKGKLTIQERATSISEIDEKIVAIKSGDIGETITLKKLQENDFLVASQNPILQAKSLIKFIKDNAKWKMNEKENIIFDIKNMQASIVKGDKIIYTANITFEKNTIKYATNVIEFGEKTTVATFRWQGGNLTEITLIKD